MAQIVITLSDDENDNVVMDVSFNPPINDDMTVAQGMALRMMNWFGGHRTKATRENLQVIYYPRPSMPLHLS